MQMENISLQLINAVKERPILYDTSLNAYKNTCEKKRVWQEVAEEIGIKDGGETTSWRWKNLRDSYSKYLRAKRNDRKVKKFGKWQWAEYMDFMDPYMRITRHVNDTPSTSGDKETQNNEQVDIPPKYKRRRSSSLNMVQEESSSDMDLSEYKKSSNSYVGVKPMEELMIINNASCPQDPDITNSSERLDRIDYLFLNYAETFKKLTPRRQAVLKLQMAKIFAQAELQEIDRTPIQFEITDEDLT